jgi:hypothetical protein
VRNLRVVIVVLGLLLVAACGGELRRTGQIDSSHKVISVEPGGGLLGQVKDMLIAEGWRVVVGRESEARRQPAGPFLEDRPPRYKLVMQFDRHDTCITSGLYTYNLSVVDLRDGTEVLTLTGYECAEIMLRRFREALRGGN